MEKASLFNGLPGGRHAKAGRSRACRDDRRRPQVTAIDHRELRPRAHRRLRDLRLVALEDEPAARRHDARHVLAATAPMARGRYAWTRDSDSGEPNLDGRWARSPFG